MRSEAKAENDSPRYTDADGAETIVRRLLARGRLAPEARLALQTGTIGQRTTTTAAATTALACDVNGMLALTSRSPRARQSLLPTPCSPKRPREYLDDHLDEHAYAPDNAPNRPREIRAVVPARAVERRILGGGQLSRIKR